MKTISFKVEYTNNVSIEYDSRVYSSIVRYAFNRLQENNSTTLTYQDVVKKFKLSSHLCNCAIREAKGIIKRFKKDELPKKFHFGDIKRRSKRLISYEEYKQSRNLGFFSEGENGCAKGNRLFKIDLQNNSIIYKRSRTEHIKLKIQEKLSDKRKRILESLYLVMENKISPVSFKIKNDNLYITYDETVIESFKKFKDLKSNRILGIDLNPNYIGLSILEFDKEDNFKIIHKRVYDLSELNDTENKNKIKFELQQIDNEILKLCKHFKVSKIVVEDLKFKNSNKHWSKKNNKLCRNQFRYNQITQHLNILCNVYGVNFIEVNAAYTSIIGSFIHGNKTTPDMVAASIEIARRGYKIFFKNWFYPTMVNIERIKEVIGTQWKDELKLHFNSWKELGTQIKESKLKYRFQLEGSVAVFRKDYYKKKVNIYCFI